MSSKIQIISVISFLSYSIIIGALVFSRGFLLNRQVITDKAGRCLDTRYRHHYHQPQQSEDGVPERGHLVKQEQELLSNLSEAATWCQKTPPVFNKAILILVDALRHDFVERMPFLAEVVRKQKEEQEKEVNNVKNGKGRRAGGVGGGASAGERSKMSSCMFKFVADPPTTTMQRLKALMTGTMPTFIDASANFNSYEVEEDSLIYQLYASGKKLAFLGDDTWLSLFPPKYFTSPFVEAHPSFNAWDLDTVDRAVNYTLRNKIFNNQRRQNNDNESSSHTDHRRHHDNEWDVLIAHILGVDHCGHRYGPSHPEMKRKLNEADSIINFVFDSMSEDTLLVVFGDHGMTSTGDHGGDSRDETDSAVIFIAKNKGAVSSTHSSSASSLAFQCPFNTPGISQIDLVPTLAMLLGVPIPFSSIGQLIPNILSSNKRELYTDALSANAAQVETYIQKFGLSSQSSSIQEDYLRLQEAFHQYQLARTNHSCRAKVNSLAHRYLSHVKALAVSTWTQFNVPMIYTGVAISGMAVVSLAIYLANVPTLLLVTTQYSVLSWLWPSLPVWSVLWSFSSTTPTSSNLLAIIISTLGGLAMFLLCVAWKLIVSSFSSSSSTSTRISDDSSVSIGWSLCDFGGVLMYILTCLAMFSNSFVINEGYMLGSVLMLVVFLHIVFSSSSSTTSSLPTEKSTLSFNPSKEESLFHVIILRKRLECSLACFLMLGLLVRTCSIFFRCREELQQCSEEYLLHKQLASLPEEWLVHKYVRYSIALLSLAIFVVAFRLWMLYQKCLFTKTPAAIVAKFIPTLLVVLLGVFWALQGLPFITISPIKLKPILNNFPWVFQTSTLVSLVLVWLRPIFSSTDPSDLLFHLPSSPSPPCSQCALLSAKKLRTPASTKSYLSSTSNGLLQQPQPIHKKLPPSNGFKKLPNGTPKTNSPSLSKSPVYVDLDTPHLLEDTIEAVDDYSCSILLFTTLVIILMTQITSVGIAPAVSIIIPYMIVALVGIFRTSGHDSWCAAVVWTLLSQYMFYGTGHQPIFSAIPWDSAFLSVNDGQSFTDSAHSYLTWLRPAFAIMGNLHVSQIIFSLALPLLAYWSPGGHHLCHLHQHRSCRSRRRMSYLLSGKFIMLHGLKLFACMACAGWHRRHLMVWKIFAPKFIFEVISFIIIMFTTVFSLCFVTRIDYLYHQRHQIKLSQKASALPAFDRNH